MAVTPPELLARVCRSSSVARPGGVLLGALRRRRGKSSSAPGTTAGGSSAASSAGGSKASHGQGQRRAHLRVLGRQPRRDSRLQVRQGEVRGGQPRRHDQPQGRPVRRLLLRHRPRHPGRQRTGHLPRRLHDDRQVQQGRRAARRLAVLLHRRGRRVPAGAVGRGQVQRRPLRRAAPDRHHLRRLQQGRVRSRRHHLGARHAGQRLDLGRVLRGRGQAARSRCRPTSSRSPTTGRRPARSAGCPGSTRPAARC